MQPETGGNRSELSIWLKPAPFNAQELTTGTESPTVGCGGNGFETKERDPRRSPQYTTATRTPRPFATQAGHRNTNACGVPLTRTGWQGEDPLGNLRSERRNRGLVVQSRARHRLLSLFSSFPLLIAQRILNSAISPKAQSLPANSPIPTGSIVSVALDDHRIET